MSKKNKRILTTVALIVIFACIGCLTAYLVWITGQPNKLKIGQGDAKIEETFNPPPKLNKGANIYQKLVTVKNTGKNLCFVRVFMDFSDSETKKSTYFFKPNDGVAIPTEAPDLNTTIGTWEPASTWRPDNDWEYVEDGDLGGFYYYKKPVDVGFSTTPLISWVKTDFVDENKITDYQILVYSETVQIVEMNGTEYDDTNYKQAWNEFLRTGS